MEKAVIKNVDTKDEIKCLFNPNQYVYARTVAWTPSLVKGADLPMLEFGGGASATLTMDLFLDTTVTGGNLSDTILKFRELMAVRSQDEKTRKGRPPLVGFYWGQGLQFSAVITGITETCTMFRDDGSPVRATLHVTFLQAEKYQLKPKEQPAGSEYEKYTVSEGDTIDSIASSKYGDAAMWRYIAEANGLVEPGNLKPGDILEIPPAP